MKAMILNKIGSPLELVDIPVPEPADNEVLIRVGTCGVCRSDIHIIDGDLDEPNLPLVPGHEIVGKVVDIGSEVTDLSIGSRVGVPWLGRTCNDCEYCHEGFENLCRNPIFTGYNRNGGYAEYTIADSRFCFRIPEVYSDIEAAPLLCAGLIGYRCFRMTETASKLGFYGFGAAAHILTQVAVYEGRKVFAFTRPGDEKKQQFARELGAHWVGGSDESPPEELDAAIIFAPDGSLVINALKAIRPGGSVICGGIHMSDIPSFPYRLLWEEKSIRTVANLTRQDGVEFMELAPNIPVGTETTVFPLEDANQAIEALRSGQITGAAVLQIGESSF